MEKLNKLSRQEIKELGVENIDIYVNRGFGFIALLSHREIHIGYKASLEKIKAYITESVPEIREFEKKWKETEKQIKENVEEVKKVAEEAEKKIKNLEKSIRKKLKG